MKYVLAQLHSGHLAESEQILYVFVLLSTNVCHFVIKETQYEWKACHIGCVV